MSNIKYLKGVRTRYLNTLKREIENASSLVQNGDAKMDAREILPYVTSCCERLQILTNKLEIQSEKVASAITDAEEDFTEDILKEDSETCESALLYYSRLKQFEQVLRDQIKSEDLKPSSDVGEPKSPTQLEMQKLFEMQLDLQKQFLKHTTTKPKEVNSVKLPKLEKSSFNGDKLRWSNLTDRAKGAITGLALTSENYDVAIEILSKRFGDTQEIIDTHYNKIINLRPANDSVESLRAFIDIVDKNLRSLEVLGQNVNQEIFVSVIKSKLPTNIVRHIEIQKGTSTKWTVKRLRDLLTEYVVAFEKADKVKRDGAFVKINKPNSPNGSQTKGFAEALASTTQDTSKKVKARKCKYCLKDHWSDECTEYKSIRERKDRLKGCCYRCLTKGHMSGDCRSSRACVFCNQMNIHHRSLCPKKFPSYSAKESVQVVDEVSVTCEHSCVVEENVLLSSSETVMMQTAHTSVKCPGEGQGAREVRLLLDSGSQRTYITEKLANSLGLKGELEQDIRLVTFGSKNAKVIKTKSTIVNLRLKGGGEMTMSVNIVPDITGTIQRKPVNIVDKINFKCLTENLEMADIIPTKIESDTIDLLIGNDYYLDLILGHKIEVQPGLYLLSSKLGWLLTGRTSAPGEKVNDVSMLILTHGTNVSSTEVFTSVDKVLPIKPNLEDFWKIESIGVYDSPQDCDDEIAMKNFKDTLIFKDNRYHVTWPWASESPIIPSNRQLAVGRLKSLMTRLHSKPEIKKKYADVIDDQLKKNIIEKVDRYQSDGTRHYIPHHAVVKPDNSTTKLRVVYDASAKTKAESKSLNESLYRGPVLLRDLCGILLRFRLHKTAIVSDIEKAFLQISLQPSQRDVTRFLWLKDIDGSPSDPENVQEYRFCRVPFGVISSPFLLGATVNHHLDTYDSNVAKQIKRDIYMDNVITGTDSVDEGEALYHESKVIFSEAGMNLREWASNDENLVKRFPEPDRASGECMKVLGLTWNKTNDVLSVKPIKDISTNEITKRQVLKQLAMVFDPLGLFSPVTLKGKLLLQSLWSKQLKWDEELDEGETQIWRSIRKNLLEIPSVVVPRCAMTSGASAVNYLFCFCDASEKAYATIIYLVQRGNGQSRSELVFSKSRLAPTTKTSIPRLELLAVLIGARCVSFVKSEMCTQIEKCILFSDSQCTLDWIDSNKKLPVFVQNRVQEIKQHSDITFHYVSTCENPADIASRGCDLNEIALNKLWWNGPDWIQKEEKDWPPHKCRDSDGSECSNESVPYSEKCLVDCESNPLRSKDTNNSPMEIDIERYSSGKRLLRVTATVLRFIGKLKGVPYPKYLTHKEIDKAEELWIKHTQEHYFGDVYKAIQDNKKHNLVTQLGLYFDESQIIRCKGRLNNSCLAEGARNPILIPRDSKFSHLVIQQIHKKFQHMGVSQSLSILRQRFWIPRGRATIRKVISGCLVCKRLEGSAYKMPPLAPLPSSRVSEAPPFSCIGIDYMGPMYIKEDNQQKKVWVCLYTCMITRATHLEMVTSMSTEAFLNCFRRFIACRGKPNEIVCDNAMQFKLARETLDLVWGDVVRCEDVQSYCASEGIKWNFIVELAPWMGGFYERMVGLIKRSMRKAIGRKILDRDQLHTVLKESEAVVNSRPLVYVGDDVNSTIAIAPGHFICLNPRMGLPDCDQSEQTEEDPDFNLKDSSSEKLLKIWKKGQKLLDKFWTIWRDEYLTSLRERTRTKLRSGRSSSVEDAKIGDVVLVKDSIPRGSWRFGRIVELIQSKDACVRSAKVRTSTGNILGRPLCSLYPIETSGVEKNQEQVQNTQVKSNQVTQCVRRSTRKTNLQTNVRIKQCIDN